MTNSAWIALLRLMAPRSLDNLLLVTTIGQEISVQSVFRMEADFVVLRGRLAGTTDAGRVYVIPYDQIHYVGFQQAMKEEQVIAIFGNILLPAATPEEPAVVAADLPPSLIDRSAVVVSAAPEAAPPAPDPRLKQPSKIVLLERVRARLAAAAKANPPSPS